MSLGTVLVVDDEEDIREALTDFLRSRDYHVVTASDGQAALDVLRAVYVDLVLLDMVMPQLGGLEALALIRTLYPDLPVVLVTASADTDAITDAVTLGAAEYIAKPFNFVEVEQVVGVHIGIRRLQRGEGSPPDQ